MPATWVTSPPGGQTTSPSESRSGHSRLRLGCAWPARGGARRLGGVTGAGPAGTAVAVTTGGRASARGFGFGPGRRRGLGRRTLSHHSPSRGSGPGIQRAPPMAARGNPSSPHLGPRSQSLGEAVLQRLHLHLPDSSSHATSWDSAPAGPPAARWHRASHWPCSLALPLGHRSSLQGPPRRLCRPCRVCRTQPHREHDTSSSVRTR